MSRFFSRNSIVVAKANDKMGVAEYSSLRFARPRCAARIAWNSCDSSAGPNGVSIREPCAAFAAGEGEEPQPRPRYRRLRRL